MKKLIIFVEKSGEEVQASSPRKIKFSLEMSCFSVFSTAFLFVPSKDKC